MKKDKRALLRLIILSAFIIMVTAFFAAADGSHTIAVSVCTDERIVYSVHSDEAGINATAVTATYLGGKMREVKTDSFQTGEEPHNAAQTLSLPFDSVKILLLDSDTNIPLCESVRDFTVTFSDHDDQVLSEQKVFTGQSAVPPEPPEQSGNLFVKWDSDYKTVFEDMTVKPVYVRETAENIFTVSSATVNAGEEVCVTLGLTGTVNVCAFDLRLHYDDELEFVSMDSALSFALLANHSADKNYVRLNYQMTDNRNTGGEIIKVTFLAKKKGVASVTVEPVSVICVDPQDPNNLPSVEHTKCEGVIVIK